jgi:hypothetical protein
MTLRERLMLAGARVCYAPEDGAGGGAPAGGGTAAAPAASTDAATAPAAPTSIVDTPAADEGGANAQAGADGGSGEKAEGDAKERSEETPEAKAEREKAEAEAKIAETVKAYDEALKLPEGADPNQPAWSEFKQTAAKHGLSSDAAQALVDAVAPKFQEALEAPFKTWGDTQEKWIGEIKADKDYGGDIAKAAGIARKGIDAVMGGDAAAVREALAFTGAGNNPAVFKLLVRLGTMASEGSFVPGKPAPADRKTVGQIMYPSLSPKE